MFCYQWWWRQIYKMKCSLLNTCSQGVCDLMSDSSSPAVEIRIAQIDAVPFSCKFVAELCILFDWNTYIADPEETIYSRYAMVNHGTDAEARLVADGWQPLISTEDLIVYERPDTQ